METLFISLEAINPERRCWRSYCVRVTRDLFGFWLVELTNGRIGSAGATKRYAATDETAARTIVANALRRRRSAPRTLGVPYAIREFIGEFTWMANVPLGVLAGR